MRRQNSKISGKEQKTGLNSQNLRERTKNISGKEQKTGSTLKNLRGKNEIMNLVRISSAVF